MCSLIASVEDGRIVRVQGDPDHPYTAGFACGKVNRDADLVNSPERIATPLRRAGAKGSGQFKPITWDEALDEITTKWKAIIAESGPQALLAFVIREGRNRQVRNMCDAIGHPVVRLRRRRIGPIIDEHIRPGEFRDLTEREVALLRKFSAGDSRSLPPKGGSHTALLAIHTPTTINVASSANEPPVNAASCANT